MRRLIAALCLSAALTGTLDAAELKQTKLTFPNGKTIVVDVVDTPEQRERGLMHRKSLPKDYGMMFVFAHEGGMQFWMKNTWVPLDMVFIGKDKRITKLHRGVKASTEKTTDAEIARAGGLGQYVVELPTGAVNRHKLKEGQKLKFEVVIPQR